MSQIILTRVQETYMKEREKKILIELNEYSDLLRGTFRLNDQFSMQFFKKNRRVEKKIVHRSK